MTREEAIEFLNVMWETLFQEMRTRTFNELEEQGLCDKFKEALDMAIEALSAETCEDCISRVEALRNLAFTDSKDEVYRMIQELSSVTPKPKTGHWVDGHCSECGCDVPAYIIDWKWQKDMDAKYCPNCGIKMESGV